MYADIISKLNPTNTQLIAVSKTKPQAAILALYAKGQRAFGENYVQELVEKQATLPNDIDWHMIGHLQTNKVKYIAPFIHTIHSVDSFKLLLEINKQAAKHGRLIRVLLQFHIADEDSKFGFDTEGGQWHHFDFHSLQNISVAGVMGMATFTDDKTQVRKEFQKLKQIFDNLKTQYFADSPAFKEISMGMSNDFELAIAEGSTMVRIGSLLFGQRLSS
jgi:hypothetical protein